MHGPVGVRRGGGPPAGPGTDFAPLEEAVDRLLEPLALAVVRAAVASELGQQEQEWCSTALRRILGSSARRRKELLARNRRGVS